MSSLEKLHRTFTGRTVALKSIDMLTAEERRGLLRYLFDENVTPHPAEVVEPYSQTGLPQKLRGSIHELTRNYPANLVVDAAMLEMPEDRREAVARCFLPVEPENKHEVQRYELVDSETGDELWEGDEPFTPQRFDYVAADGSVKGYQREGFMAYEFGPGAEGITGRSYYRSLEDIAEQEEASLREQLAKLKPAPKPEPKYTYIDSNGDQLLQSDIVETNFFMRDVSGEVTHYRLMDTMPEYGPDGTRRVLARYVEVVVK
jgi:hypothetical protein